MKKNVCVFIFAVILIASFIGCTNEDENPHSLESALEESKVNITAYEYFPENTGLAISRFSQDLFRKLLASDDKNVVVSPVSAYYVLSMVSLGAEGDTLYEFESVLGGNAHEIARELSALSHNLTSAGSSTRINMAGSVWVTDDYIINPDFNRTMITYFHAPALTRDFSEQSVVDEINAWIYDQTQGLIDKTLEQIEPDVIMLLINTLYLSAKWASNFNPMAERQSVFYPENCEQTEVTFLYTNHISLSVSITDYYEAVLLPYSGRLGFFMVRPTTGKSVRDFATSYDILKIFNEIDIRSEVLVSMPMLDLDYSIRMNDYLEMMGLILAFDDRLSGLGEMIEDDASKHIYLSEVRQQIRLKVHSEGTEASAITVGLPALESALQQPIEINFNTPYIFMIYDTHTNIPLFMGVTDNP
ncbi:MAG: hypothetical protein FWE27_03415 [Defluviitaleaceae bacterium]|nr:hypothetical protein [Defluviitaleaceae bacterium]